MGSKKTIINSLIVIGIGVLIGGLSLTFSGTDYFYHPPDEFISTYNENRGIALNIGPYNIGETDNPTTISFKINFNTKDAFAVDNRINITAQAKIGGPPHETEVYLFLDDYNINYTAINTENFQFVKNYAESNSGILQLEFVSNMADGSRLYETEGHTFYRTEQNLSFLPVVLGPNYEFAALPVLEDLLTIGPASTKIQAEAAKADLKNAQEQDKSNKIIIGLTIVIISVMLLAVPSDFYLVENRKNQEKKGETGDKGELGDKGETGDKGSTGDKGETGDKVKVLD